jgi:hypothetical protein
MDWIDRLRDILCRLYQELGGNCADLGAEPTQWVQTVVSRYAVTGPPVFPTEEEQQAFLKVLSDLESHLALPENTLSPGDNAKLTNLIASLRAGLGV